MGKIFDMLLGDNKENKIPVIKEEIKAFQNKGDFNKNLKTIMAQKGEGWETLAEIPGFSNVQIQGFNLFYSTYINRVFEHELQRIEEYRSMSTTPEISDVIEDAVNESTQEDDIGEVFHLDIIDKKLQDNENMVKTLKSEFNELFRERLNMKEKIWDILWTFYIDGRVYYEIIVDENKKKDGIINVKKLPTETMDFFYDPISGRISGYIQYLKPKTKRPATIKEARERDGKDLIFFDPNQIGFVDYGIYGKSRYEIIGYLEKARVPFNQLKLLETAVIIMRIVRAPERYVFRIDTGNMPREKALKYVEMIKNKMQKKQTYDPRTGTLTHEPEIMGILENFYLPQCLRISNTYIDLLDGRSISLEQLIKEHNDGKKHEVYSVDQNNGKIIRGEVEWAGITRKNAEMVRVYLDNDEYIDCTPDHKFVMRDGKEIEAKNLKPNDSLMPLYKKKEKINKNTNDYLMVFNPESNKYKFVHRLLGPEQKKGNAIHHKNFNRFDNTEDNLESLPIKEHIRLHYKSNKERESHIPLLEALNKPENRERQRKKAKESKIEYFKNPDNREKISKWATERWMDDNEYRQIVKKSSSRTKSNEHKNNLSESGIAFYNTDEGKNRKKEIGIESKERWMNNREYMIEKISDGTRKMYNSEKGKIVKQKISDFTSVKTSKKLAEILLSEYSKFNHIPTSNELLNSLQNNIDFMNKWKELNNNNNCVNTEKLSRKVPLYIIKDHFDMNSYVEFKSNVIVNHKVVMVEKLSYKEDTGCLTIKDSKENHNFGLSVGVFVKNSAEGRGSSIDTIGGNTNMFSELDDVYYFQKKLYRSLKYPASRVTATQEGRDGEMMFGGQQSSEISRDEIKWAKFLERQQKRICNNLKDMFLLHLEFKGIKKQYDLTTKKIDISMNAPSKYKEQMEQMFTDSRFNNYQQLADRPEMSKYYLMKRYLKWDDEEIKANVEGKQMDVKLGLAEEEGGGNYS